MNRVELLVSQLDGLVVFMAAAHREVFDTIRGQESVWFPSSQDPRVPDTFEAYQVCVHNAAFLLGYAYIEAFLADLTREVYLRRPSMLPPERTIEFKEIVAAGSKQDIIRLMTEKQIRSVFGGKAEDVVKHFRASLEIPWPQDAEQQFVLASRIRNCLMHNGGIVDDRLAKISDFEVRKRICLEANTVHGFGIMARRLARALWEKAERCHLHAARGRAARGRAR